MVSAVSLVLTVACAVALTHAAVYNQRTSHRPNNNSPWNSDMERRGDRHATNRSPSKPEYEKRGDRHATNRSPSKPEYERRGDRHGNNSPWDTGIERRGNGDNSPWDNGIERRGDGNGNNSPWDTGIRGRGDRDGNNSPWDTGYERRNRYDSDRRGTGYYSDNYRKSSGYRRHAWGIRGRGSNIIRLFPRRHIFGHRILPFPYYG